MSRQRAFELARAQHFVNQGRRKQNKPVVYRSGIYSGSDSTDALGSDDILRYYAQLRKARPPPWDLSLILEGIEAHPELTTNSEIFDWPQDPDIAL